MIGKINNYLQYRMRMENVNIIPLTVAARWLDEAGILKNPSSSRGHSLRRHAQRGNIFGAFKKSNYYWYIRKIDNYDPVLTIPDLKEIFGMKSPTSVYRKLRYHQIPFFRNHRKGIFVKLSDLLKWSMINSRQDVLEKIKEMNINTYFIKTGI